MPRQGKKMVEENWLVGYQVAYGHGIIDYDSLGLDVWADEKEFVGMDQADLKSLSASSPESNLMKRDLVNHLTSEAKEVVSLILNGPSEVIESFKTLKYDCISKTKIAEYLTKIGWKTRKIDRVFREIKQFSKEISEI